MKKVIVITGASRGIGRNIAYNLAIDGYTVIANYNRSEKEAIELKGELAQKGIEIDIFKADVSQSEEVRKLIDFTINNYLQIFQMKNLIK